MHQRKPWAGLTKRAPTLRREQRRHLRHSASAPNGSSTAPAAIREFFLLKLGTSKCAVPARSLPPTFWRAPDSQASTQQFRTIRANCRQRCGFDRALQFRCGVSSDCRRVGVNPEGPRARQTNVVIAGNPDTAEQLRNLGIADFIHLRSNAVEVLAGIQRLIGIKD